MSVRLHGDRNGFPVLALHGTPGSRLKFSSADSPARCLGLALVAPDRWGYGGTSIHHSPSLAAFATDMLTMLDAIGVDRFALLGVSGGGPYAAAVAARAGKRASALALVAPVGPIEGNDRQGFSYFHRFCFGPLARRPRAVAGVFNLFRRIVAWDPELGARIAAISGPAADRRVMADAAVRRRLGATFNEGLRTGVAGPVIDLSLFGRAWDVDPSAIVAQSRLWIGTRDRSVPLPAAHRLAAMIPSCDTISLADHGHLWVARNYDVVLRWIARAVPAAGGLQTS